MLTLRRLQLLIVALLAMALLAACGGGGTADVPTAAPEPTAKPTLTPRPTAKPKPTAEPTEEPTAEPTEEPTAEPEPTAAAGDKLLDVEVGDLKTFTPDNKLFTIDAPANWTLKDNSKPTEAIVTWTDEHENAFMQVDIFEQEKKQTGPELAEFLKNYLEKTFGSQADFEQEDAKESGPSQLIVWTYTGEGTGGVKAKLLANSFIKQIDNKVSLFTLVVPEEQFDRLQPDLDKVLGSYSIDSSVALNAGSSADGCAGGATGDVEIGDLSTYSYKTGLFTIDVPQNWHTQDTSKSGEAILVWCAPQSDALVAVDIFQQPENQTADQLTKLLQTYLKNTFGSEQDFNLEDPKTQTDGSVLIVWSYVDKTHDGLKVLGNSFIEQHGDKGSILTTVLPSEQFDTLKPDTNKIINSYKIDASSDLP